MGFIVGDRFFESRGREWGFAEVKQRNWSGVGPVEYVQLYFDEPGVPVLAFTAKQARVLASALLQGATYIDRQSPEDDGEPIGWDRNWRYGPPWPETVAVEPAIPHKEASYGVDAAILGNTLDPPLCDPV